MLSKAKEKLIRSLQTKKGREKSGLCLVEGTKVVETAGAAIDFTFTRRDTEQFDELVTTQAAQDIAGVAQIPSWTAKDVESKPTIVVADGVQDPGNVGSILRLALGFDASLVLIESADVSSPKVVRSSVGALFHVPWIALSREEAHAYIAEANRDVFRLEKTPGAKPVASLRGEEHIFLLVGSEGSGIHLANAGTSVVIDHDARLESLNAAHALAIALYTRSCT